MPRYIDAEKIRLYKGFFEKIDNVPKFYEWLKTLPTADVVEVVRCKDCKWRHDDSIPEHLPCMDWYPHDNFFCAYGERGAE